MNEELKAYYRFHHWWYLIASAISGGIGVVGFFNNHWAEAGVGIVFSLLHGRVALISEKKVQDLNG